MMDQLREQVNTFRKLVGPLQRSVRLMLTRGVMTLVDDTTKTQEVQLNLLSGEVLSGLERFQQYGFTSVPFAGAEAIAAFVAGNRTQGVVLVVGDKRYRLKALQGGEVALHDDQGQTIVIHRDKIAVTSPLAVEMTTPLFTLNGDMQVNGGITTTKDVVADGISVDNHTHKNVQPGSGSSGGPQ